MKGVYFFMYVAMRSSPIQTACAPTVTVAVTLTLEI